MKETNTLVWEQQLIGWRIQLYNIVSDCSSVSLTPLELIIKCFVEALLSCFTSNWVGNERCSTKMSKLPIKEAAKKKKGEKFSACESCSKKICFRKNLCWSQGIEVGMYLICISILPDFFCWELIIVIMYHSQRNKWYPQMCLLAHF